MLGAQSNDRRIDVPTERPPRREAMYNDSLRWAGIWRLEQSVRNLPRHLHRRSRSPLRQSARIGAPRMRVVRAHVCDHSLVLSFTVSVAEPRNAVRVLRYLFALCRLRNCKMQGSFVLPDFLGGPHNICYSKRHLESACVNGISSHSRWTLAGYAESKRLVRTHSWFKAGGMLSHRGWPEKRDEGQNRFRRVDHARLKCSRGR